MKTIIKPGKKYYSISCNYCGCVFTYQDEDVKTEKNDFGGEQEYVSCPYCEVMIFLKGTK